MPATECLCQSTACPIEYQTLGGLPVTIRNGCVVAERPGRPVLTRSDQTVAWLLNNARLTKDQEDFISYWGAAAFGASSYAPEKKPKGG